MSTKSELLQLLQTQTEDFISGQQLAERLGVSRNAIWKAVTALKKDGYTIEGRSNVGYRLIGTQNVLTEMDIRSHLTADCDLQVYDSVTSTNDLAKAAALKGKPLTIVANMQTAGRGRLGRSFLSPSGTGLYMSMVLQPDFDLVNAPFVTMAQAVATCRAIETVCHVEPQIKWVNDLFLQQKKICGILTEAQTNFETGKIDRLVIGTGINCFPGSFPPEIASIAGSIAQEPQAFSRSELAAHIINETLTLLSDLESRAFLDEYRDRCMVLGKNIRIHPNYDDMGVPARALDIADDGGLLVEYADGSREKLQTGEISIHME